MTLFNPGHTHRCTNSSEPHVAPQARFQCPGTQLLVAPGCLPDLWIRQEVEEVDWGCPSPMSLSGAGCIVRLAITVMGTRSQSQQTVHSGGDGFCMGTTGSGRLSGTPELCVRMSTHWGGRLLHSPSRTCERQPRQGQNSFHLSQNSTEMINLPHVWVRSDACHFQYEKRRRAGWEPHMVERLVPCVGWRRTLPPPEHKAFSFSSWKPMAHAKSSFNVRF